MRKTINTLLLIAVALPAAAQTRTTQRSDPDSVILDRIGAATGGYPSYRVTTRANGSVRFESLTPGDSGRVVRTEARSGVASRVSRALDQVRFYDLPPVEYGKAPYCQAVMMDVGETQVTVFRGAEARARTYSGCIGGSEENNLAEPLNRRVEEIADSIEAITGAKQWIRGSPAPPADSVVLERTDCLGDCPVYRLVIRSDGSARFQSGNKGEEGRVESAPARAGIMLRLLTELERAGFRTMPKIEIGKEPFCRIVATDSPTYGVIIFSPTRADTLRYYIGCGGPNGTARPFVGRLRAMADSIDAISGAKAWITPNTCWLPRPGCK
jgi:hypothetical protein